MGRTDNLNNFLTDVAGAIRAKTGKSAQIPAPNFTTEIASIPSGSGGGLSWQTKYTGGQTIWAGSSFAIPNYVPNAPIRISGTLNTILELTSYDFCSFYVQNTVVWTNQTDSFIDDYSDTYYEGCTDIPVRIITQVSRNGAYLIPHLLIVDITFPDATGEGNGWHDAGTQFYLTKIEQLV